MNGLKKFMSAAIAAAMLLVGTAFTVSADYDSYDVNRDGTVSPADLVQLNKYLCGAFSYTNYNLCDVNQNLVADAADAECLKLRILRNDYSSAYYSRKTGTTVAAPTVSGFTPSESSASSTGRRYKRCSYDSNGTPTTMPGYTLTPTLMTLPEADTRQIIGEKDMYDAYGEENSGIVYLKIKYFDNINNKFVIRNVTGFIVGDHEIATAAHCIYKNNKWNSLITIKTSNPDGNVSNTTLTPVQGHIPLFYSTNSSAENSDHMYDYGLITVEEDLSDYVHFSLGTPYNVSESAYSNIPVYVTGIPYDCVIIMSAEGRVLNKTDFFSKCTDVIFYDTDAIGGQSGSPVYTITKIGDKYVYTAIGIHHGGNPFEGRNCGSMITNYHLQFYLNNPNASHESN